MKTMVVFKKLYFGTLFLLGIYLKGYTDYKLWENSLLVRHLKAFRT